MSVYLGLPVKLYILPSVCLIFVSMYLCLIPYHTGICPINPKVLWIIRRTLGQLGNICLDERRHFKIPTCAKFCVVLTWVSNYWRGRNRSGGRVLVGIWSRRYWTVTVTLQRVQVQGGQKSNSLHRHVYMMYIHSYARILRTYCICTRIHTLHAYIHTYIHELILVVVIFV